MRSYTEQAGPRDEELVLAAQGGDHDAFAVLMERHQATALKLALSVLRNRCDAEDELQNASWKAFQHIDRFQNESKFSTWYSRIVINQCLMRLRQQRRSRLVFFEDLAMAQEGSAPIEFAGTGVSPEEELGQREVGDMLDQEVQRMPRLLRRVFELRDLEERPMAEVAEELNISVPAAKSRLLRARQELRRKLDKHCGRLGLATLTS